MPHLPQQIQFENSAHATVPHRLDISVEFKLFYDP